MLSLDVNDEEVEEETWERFDVENEIDGEEDSGGDDEDSELRELPLSPLSLTEREVLPLLDEERFERKEGIMVNGSLSLLFGFTVL